MSVWAFNGDIYNLEVYEGDNGVVIAVVEAKDIAAFSMFSQTPLSFAIVEAKDIAAFDLDVIAFASFDVTEAPDIAAFDILSAWDMVLDVTDENDTAAFNLELLAAFISFDVNEPVDTVYFRAFFSFLGDGVYDGEEGYVYVVPENRFIRVTPRLLKKDRVP